MDFALSPESKMMVKTAREFAEHVIEPVAARIEDSARALGFSDCI